MKAVLKVTNVSKRFLVRGGRKVVQAVNGVSFQIAVRQTLALVGESGSGKTTVGRCIMGLSGSFDGTISFLGQDLEQHRRALLGRTQIVFQEPFDQLDPRMSIAQSVEEPLVALRVSAAERRRKRNAVLELVGLGQEDASLYPAQLSAGQQQRIGIARAMITDPDLLVLDEPTSALDPSARAEIIALLMKIQRDRGTAYLFISHDLSTVRFLADRVAVMYLGMIVEEGPTTEVFARPRHPYSRGLLGSVLLPHPGFPPSDEAQLSGEIPSPIDLPKGCFLASRCPFVIEACKTAIPPVEAVGPDHFIRCIRSDEIGVSAQNDVFEQFQIESERILSVGSPLTPSTMESLHNG
ncbi:ABC transporter ATP-binding protein [Aminobacter sp. MSH1]|uniref:ABC transporter ATP-binding protein n=1 Tax=Aminobacter sp. MSH1 TaxID=374606 RepID=UPI00131F39C6|nr:ABC transporter ATP-binding protein [Aminobacter sp. MSH1]